MKIQDIKDLLNYEEKVIDSKLSVVKTINEISGLTLWDSKDLVDKYFNRNRPANSKLLGTEIIEYFKSTDYWSEVKNRIRKLK